LLNTAAAVDTEVVVAAAEGMPADSAAVAVMPVGLAAVAAADSAVVMQLASQADTQWWAARAATPADTEADRTTPLGLDTRQDFAAATLVGASPMHTVT
jgi:hypothetical protein